MKRPLTILIVGLVSLLAACGGAGPGANSSVRQIVMLEMSFAPNRIDAHVGETITIRLVNQGGQKHDFLFPALHMPGLEGKESIVEPGATATLSVRFDEPGVHRFICSLPGHAAMTGAVYVSP
ncbi:MAG TPA: cupredoxin domain-containing protein [Candidatus Limnocylindrales bacterium]|nr:cupredoxin domain-containing protein [Candidatus Limnocylindrales bacterium]